MSADLVASPALLRTPLVQAGRYSSSDEVMFGAGHAYTAPVHRPASSFAKALPGFGRYGFAWRQFSAENRALAHAGRRVRGGDGRLPAHIRRHYTEGQRAALSIVAEEVRKRGQCTLMVARIARRARVGIRTVQYALKHAMAFGHLIVRYDRPPRSRTNNPNIIRIADAAWLRWIKPKRSDSAKAGCKQVHTYESMRTEESAEGGETAVTVFRKDPAPLTWALEGANEAGSEQPIWRRRGSGG